MVKVGAATEAEMKEKKARVEDALHATRAAVEEGVVPGGGVALLRALKALAGLEDGLDEEDQKAGVRIVRRAAEEPLRWIAQNAGIDGAIVVDKVKYAKGANGFNAATETYEDLIGRRRDRPDQGRALRAPERRERGVAPAHHRSRDRGEAEEEGRRAGGMPDMGGMGGMGGHGRHGRRLLASALAEGPGTGPSAPRANCVIAAIRHSLPVAAVTESESRDLAAITADGVSFSVMVGLGETYIPAFVLAAGLGEVAAGLIATLPPLAGAVFQLVTPFAVRHLHSYRRWVVACAALQALALAPLAMGGWRGQIGARRGGGRDRRLLVVRDGDRPGLECLGDHDRAARDPQALLRAARAPVPCRAVPRDARRRPGAPVGRRTRQRARAVRGALRRGAGRAPRLGGVPRAPERGPRARRRAPRARGAWDPRGDPQRGVGARARLSAHDVRHGERGRALLHAVHVRPARALLRASS